MSANFDKFTARIGEVMQNLKSMVSAPQVPAGDPKSVFADELKAVAVIREELVKLHAMEADLLTNLSEHLATIGAIAAQLNTAKDSKTPAEAVVKEADKEVPETSAAPLTEAAANAEEKKPQQTV